MLNVRSSRKTRFIWFYAAPVCLQSSFQLLDHHKPRARCQTSRMTPQPVKTRRLNHRRWWQLKVKYPPLRKLTTGLPQETRGSPREGAHRELIGNSWILMWYIHFWQYQYLNCATCPRFSVSFSWKKAIKYSDLFCGARSRLIQSTREIQTHMKVYGNTIEKSWIPFEFRGITTQTFRAISSVYVFPYVFCGKFIENRETQRVCNIGKPWPIQWLWLSRPFKSKYPIVHSITYPFYELSSVNC